MRGPNPRVNRYCPAWPALAAGPGPAAACVPPLPEGSRWPLWRASGAGCTGARSPTGTARVSPAPCRLQRTDARWRRARGPARCPDDDDTGARSWPAAHRVCCPPNTRCDFPNGSTSLGPSGTKDRETVCRPQDVAAQTRSTREAPKSSGVQTAAMAKAGEAAPSHAGAEIGIRGRPTAGQPSVCAADQSLNGFQ